MLQLANKGKLAKLLWQQNPNESFAEYFINIRRDSYRNFKNTKGDYMKLEENSNYENIRTIYKNINEFKKGYQSHH